MVSKKSFSIAHQDEGIDSRLCNPVSAEYHILIVRGVIRVAVHANDQASARVAGVVGDAVVGTAVVAAGGLGLTVEQAAEGIGSGLGGRGQQERGVSRTRIVLVAAHYHQPGQHQQGKFHGRGGRGTESCRGTNLIGIFRPY